MQTSTSAYSGGSMGAYGGGNGSDLVSMKKANIKATEGVIASFNQLGVSTEEYKSALDVLKDATRIVSSAMGDLQFIAKALSRDLHDSAKGIIYGSSADGKVGFDKALSDTAKALSDLNKGHYQ